nr:MAG TPA: hypothetical protein [Caudoviricetes sp.]
MFIRSIYYTKERLLSRLIIFRIRINIINRIIFCLRNSIISV